MQSRMSKYYDDYNDSNNNISVGSRSGRNKELYKQVGNMEIEDFDLNSNVSIMQEDASEIDINRVKDLLEQKYREDPKDRSIVKDNNIEDIPKIHLDETREYDLNTILKKAKEEKEVDYEKERSKKLRNTQYDILKSLNMDDSLENSNGELENKKEADDKELLSLIDTITSKELIKKDDIKSSDDLDPLDLFDDLRGDDENTRVLGAAIDVDDETKKLEKTKEDYVKENKKDKTFDTSTTKDLVDSFVGKGTFDDDDFEDFKDLKEGSGFIRILIKVLVFLLVALVIVGAVYYASKKFNIGLF